MITDKSGFIQITNPPDAYEMESLKMTIRWLFFEDEHFKRGKNLISFRLNYSTSGSTKQISKQEPLKSFIRDGSKRDILGLDPLVNHENINLSHKPVYILSLDETFLETNSLTDWFFNVEEQE